MWGSRLSEQTWNAYSHQSLLADTAQATDILENDLTKRVFCRGLIEKLTAEKDDPEDVVVVTAQEFVTLGHSIYTFGIEGVQRALTANDDYYAADPDGMNKATVSHDAIRGIQFQTHGLYKSLGRIAETHSLSWQQWRSAPIQRTS